MPMALGSSAYELDPSHEEALVMPGMPQCDLPCETESAQAWTWATCGHGQAAEVEGEEKKRLSCAVLKHLSA